MGLKKCPICGEKYSDTYKRCPFCEEDENPRRARQPKRYEGGGRRLSRRNYEEDIPQPIYEDGAPRRGRHAEYYEDEEEPRRVRRDDYEDEEEYRPRRRRRDDDDYEDEEYRPRRVRRDDYDDGYDDYDDEYDDDRGSPWFKVVMVVLIAVIVACLLYLGRGMIGDLIHGDSTDPTPPSSMNSDGTQDPGDDTPAADPNAGTKPTVDEPGQTEDGNSGTDNENKADADITVTGTLALSHEDVSLAGDESFTLTAANGSGDVTYASKDPEIASVSSTGKVTGHKKGMTEIVVQRGSDSAVCIVRVKSDGTTSAAGSGTASGTLNREDMTLRTGETFALQVQGTSSAVTWSAADSGVATVDGSGKVTAVKAGTTTITASWDGQKATCIVRVK